MYSGQLTAGQNYESDAIAEVVGVEAYSMLFLIAEDEETARAARAARTVSEAATRLRVVREASEAATRLRAAIEIVGKVGCHPPEHLHVPQAESPGNVVLDDGVEQRLYVSPFVPLVQQFGKASIRKVFMRRNS